VLRRGDEASPGSPASPAVASRFASRRLPDGLRAFAYRDFRFFAVGQLISIVGTWMQQVAQSWLVLELGGDAFTVGALVATQFLPVALFGLVGGVIADALPKRRLLVLTQAWAMVLAFVLCALVVTDRVEMWMIFVLAFVLGLSNAVDQPVRQAFVIDLVDRRDLRNAIALSAAMLHGARIFGPAVAGVTIGLVGVAAAFFLNGLSFIVAIVSVLLIRGGRTVVADAAPRPRGLGELRTSLAEGMAFMRGSPLLMLGVTSVFFIATFAMNFQVLGPVLSSDVLHAGPSGLGFLMAAVGVGAFVSSMGLAFAPRPEPRLIAWGSLALGAASLLLALSTNLGLSLVGIFLGGASAVAVTITVNATIQAMVPDHLRGRSLSVFLTVHATSIPLGGILIGGVAAIWGVPVAFGLGAVVATTVGIVTFVRIPKLLAKA
jgi:MFS family permease